MSISWSDWKEINQSANYNQPAIYRVRLVREGKPVQICRFLGTDKDGILCIGKTTNMDSRRKQFVKALIGTFGHSEGNLLQILEKVSPLTALYPYRQYEYSFAKVSGTDKDTIEEVQIKSYVKLFGEVPPLNSAIPKRYNSW